MKWWPRKHGRGTRGATPASDAGRGVRRGCPRLETRLRFFFSRIRADSARFSPMRLNSCRIDFNSRRTELIRPKSSHIGSYRLVANTAGTAETGRKTVEIGRNTPETAEIGLEYGRKSRNLQSSFFFCESRHSMCFFRIF